MPVFSQFHVNTKLVGFSGCSVVKNPPANAGDAFLSIGWEDPLEKEMETHPSILDCEFPWIEEHDGLKSTGSQKCQI